MLPIGNKPVVDYVVDECVAAGMKDIYIVVNATMNDQIRTYYGHNDRLEEFLTECGAEDKLAALNTWHDGTKIHFIEQPLMRYGTAIPVWLYGKAVGMDEPVLFCNGDDFFWDGTGAGEASVLADSYRAVGVSMVTGVVKPREEIAGRYGMLELDENGNVRGLIEKPPIEKVTSDVINVNRFILTPDLLGIISRYVEMNNFGPKDQEYMITEPIDAYLRAGGEMQLVRATKQFADTGTMEGWLKANRVVTGIVVGPSF
jgi:UTP--glucose-1-phosphate uridylyltransferase